MRVFSSFALLLTLLAVSAVAGPPQAYVAKRPLSVLEETGSLNSDRKAKVALIAAGTAVNPAFFLIAGDPVKVLSTATFERQEQIMNTKTGTAFENAKVIYTCALVEAQGPPNTGRKGWTILKREVPGVYFDEYLTAAKDE